MITFVEDIVIELLNTHTEDTLRTRLETFSNCQWEEYVERRFGVKLLFRETREIVRNLDTRLF